MSNDRKRCTRCRALKGTSEFSRNQKTATGLNPHCSECQSKYWKSWYRRDPAAAIEDQTWKSMRYRYGLSKDDYLRLLADQGGVCAICQSEPDSNRRLSVDHDHRCCPGGRSCGKCVRALLCMHCNALLGNAKENARHLEAAIAYLRKWSQ